MFPSEMDGHICFSRTADTGGADDISASESHESTSYVCREERRKTTMMNRFY
jgi:hypothetical protein